MACPQEILFSLIQGSDTKFGGNHFIYDYIDTELDLTNYTATLEVPKAHYTKDLTLEFDVEKEMWYAVIDFTAEETNKMPLGTQEIIVIVYNPEGLQQSLEGIPIKVLKKGVPSSNIALNQELLIGEDGQIIQTVQSAPYSHTFLVDREKADQHPIYAITGLDARISEVEGGLAEETRVRASEDTRIEGLFSGYLPTSTKYGATFVLGLNPETYVLTATLKDQDGNTLGTAQTVDLPLESVVVNGSYDNVNKKIVLTLENGNTVDIPVGDLVAGLQNEITVNNKLSADLVDDTSTTNKFVTAGDITNWNTAKEKADTAVQYALVITDYTGD